MGLQSVMERFVFPPPSVLITVLSVANSISAAIAGFNEVSGKNFQYSKLMISSDSRNRVVIPSRWGMLIVYVPALLANIISFLFFPPDESSRSFLFRLVLTLHFLKRVLEVLFIHTYSGGMSLNAVITISISYLVSTSAMIYTQRQTHELPEPSIDLNRVGIDLFCIGIIGNGYHHYLLSKLRSGKDGEKAYKIPEGGLFSLVICPHYFFEVIEFWGFAFIAQTLFCLSSAVAVVFYLVGRSLATRKWYVSKFEDFPQHVKAIIPYVL